MAQRIVIIGGGILGLTCAYRLSEAGHHVVLLEKSEAGSGASGGNLGQISVLDRDEDWHIRAVLDTLKEYREISRNTDIEYEDSGGCVLLTEDEHIRAAEEKIAFFRKYGIESEILYGESVRKREPMLDLNSVKGVAFCPTEGKLNPLLTVTAYLEMARRNGCDVREHAMVTGFLTEKDRVTEVITDRGNFPADVVINAAGAWAPGISSLLGLSLPIGYHRGTAFVSQPVAKMIRGPVVGGGSILNSFGKTEDRHIGTALLQTKHGSILLAQATEKSEVDDRDVSVQGLCLVAKKILHHFPCLRDVEIVRSWAAVTPYDTDGEPSFGFSRKYGNFFTVAGFKGAFSTAPAVGRHVLAAIEGKGTWNTEFNPDREEKYV